MIYVLGACAELEDDIDYKIALKVKKTRNDLPRALRSNYLLCEAVHCWLWQITLSHLKILGINWEKENYLILFYYDKNLTIC